MSKNLFSIIFDLIHGSPSSTPPITTTPVTSPYIVLNKPSSIISSGITGNTLRLIAPKLSQKDADNYANLITTNMPIYNIDQEHLPMFLCQSIVESLYFTQMEENLFYTTTDALKRAWQTRFSNSTFAAQYLRNPQKLGNYVYANRYGNGNEASGDGYKHRGRGWFMYTFKANYAELAKHWNCTIDQAIARIVTPEGAVTSAMHFWNIKNMNRFSTYDDVDDCTQVLNGGLNGLDARQKAFNIVTDV